MVELFIDIRHDLRLLCRFVVVVIVLFVLIGTITATFLLQFSFDILHPNKPMEELETTVTRELVVLRLHVLVHIQFVSL